VKPPNDVVLFIVNYIYRLRKLHVPKRNWRRLVAHDYVRRHAGEDCSVFVFAWDTLKIGGLI